MISFKLLLIATSWISSLTTAHPDHPPNDTSALHARSFVADSSCNRPMPHDSTRSFRVKAAYSIRDARTILDFVTTNYNDFLHSTAYTHYFWQSERLYVLQTFDLLHYLLFNLLEMRTFCGSDQNPGQCADKPASVVSLKGGLGVLFCDSFFEQDDIAKRRFHFGNSLYGGDVWCEDNSDYGRFAVAAETVLHMLTRIQVVSEGGGLKWSGDEGGSKTGMQDVWEVGNFSDDVRYVSGGLHEARLVPWKASRTLRSLWDAYLTDPNRNYKPLQRTFRNGYSYAAAAVEFYFLKLCGWDEIAPNEPA